MINLEKGQRVNVELPKFTIGLGWDTNNQVQALTLISMPLRSYLAITARFLKTSISCSTIISNHRMVL